MKLLAEEANQDENARKELFGVISKAMACLETPAETILRIMHSVRHLFSRYMGRKVFLTMIPLSASSAFCLDECHHDGRS